MTSTRVRRTFIASPVRRAAATWDAIIDVVAPEGSSGAAELVAVSGIASSLIAAEAWRKTPMVISGVGPQLRIYCLHGEDAILGDSANEDSLAWSPTDGDWAMEMPCQPEDLAWVSAAAADVSDRVTVVDASGKAAHAMPAATSTTDGSVGEIDAEAFLLG